MKRIVLVALAAAVLGSLPGTSWGVGFTGGGGGSGGGLASGDIDTCAKIAAISTDETGTCGGMVMSTAPTIDSPIITTKMNPPAVTALPVGPSVGDTVIVTDDSVAGACDSAAGSAISLCRWSGAAWVAVGDGTSGSAAFNAITSGSNTTATMTVGAGGSVVPTSTGIIAATAIRPTILTVNAGTGAYTGLNTDMVLLCDTTAAGRTINLPAATTKIIYRIKNLGSSTCTINRAGADTIDGATSVTLTIQYQAIDLVSDGTSAWSVF